MSIQERKKNPSAFLRNIFQILNVLAFSYPSRTQITLKLFIGHLKEMDSSSKTFPISKPISFLNSSNTKSTAHLSDRYTLLKM